jgi:hypothetical protein
MGFWNTLGHAALKYGPMVAAPFTGGASLALQPYTSAADAAWSTIDANRAQFGGGIGPSGKVIKEMNTYGPTGITKVGQPVNPSSIGPTNNSPASSYGGGVNDNSQLFNPTYGMMPKDSSSPNLSFALNQGKTNALMNQPWRQSAGIYPHIPINQRQFQPQPMPLIQQPTSFQQPGQGTDWASFLQQNPNLMQMMNGAR